MLGCQKGLKVTFLVWSASAV